MGLILFGKGTRAPMSLGLSGGYPGCNVGYSTFRRGNVDELPEQPRGDARREPRGPVLGARRARGGRHPVRPLHGRRRLRRPARPRPGRGAGRRPARPRRRGRGPARSTAWSSTRRRRLDDDATRRAAARDPLGAGRRGRRLGASAPRCPPTGMRHGRVPAAPRRPGETQCTFCGELVAAAGADWKDHAVLRRSPVSKAGPLRSDTGEFVLIEAFCPGCGTPLDVELAAGDDPPLHDRVVSWPAAGP